MKKQVLTLFSIMLFVLVPISNAQSTSDGSSVAPSPNASSNEWSITWNRTYSEIGLNKVYTIIQTSDGGFLLEGTSTAPSQLFKIELVKVDSTGNPVWNKTYDANAVTSTKQLIQTSDGNYTIAGKYILASQKKVGFWLAKLNFNGDIIWTKTYFGEGFGWADSLVQTSDGGYALVGPTHADTHIIVGDMDIWLLKTDPLGNQQWARTVGTGRANSIVQTTDGGYALAAYSNSADFQLIKTSSTGTVEWSKNFGSQDKATAISVVQTSDGGFAVGGAMWLRSNGGGLNLAIVKTDATGSEQWTKYYGTGIIRSLLQTSDGGFVFANNPFVKVDGIGVEQWKLSLGDPSTQIFSVIETEDGGYAVAGSTSSYAWMAKIESNLLHQTPNPTSQIPEFNPLIVIVIFSAVTALISIARKRHTRRFGVDNYLL